MTERSGFGDAEEGKRLASEKSVGKPQALAVSVPKQGSQRAPCNIILPFAEQLEPVEV